jgi:hypothetical protein
MSPLDTLNEPIFTTQELARRKRVHSSTIRRLFTHEPGVIRLGRGHGPDHRQHFTLRIPQSVADRVFGKLTVKPEAEPR